MNNNGFRRLDKIIGSLLLLTGFGFLFLLAFIKVTGGLSSDMEVSAFMFLASVGLFYAGYRFLTTPRPANSEPFYRARWLPVNCLRLPAEMLAIVGCLSMLVRGVCIANSVYWPNKFALRLALISPVLIAQIMSITLVPGGWHGVTLPIKITERWPAAFRWLVRLLVSIGWLGYIALLFAWPEVANYFSSKLSSTATLLISLLIADLYATQAALLHWGERRSNDT